MATFEETKTVVESVMFEKIRRAYVDARAEQRKKIIKYLENNMGRSFIVREGEGCGRYDYTSKGKIVPYDLTIWKYIEALDDDYYYFISLQAFDQDPKTGNYHALMDRIGIFIGERLYKGEPLDQANKKEYRRYIAGVFRKNEEYYRTILPTKMRITDIDLPVYEPGPNDPEPERGKPVHSLGELVKALKDREKYSAVTLGDHDR